MLEYKLDDLGWERFEQVVQALLKARLGLGVEAWGGSGDWGRDAYFRGKLNYPTNAPREGGFVFQCKFVEAANAAGAKPEKPILDAVRKECVRIKDNLGDGGNWKESPTCYAFFTNAALTPKTRTKIEQLLASVLPASSSSIHDGRDICQWLRLSPDILESFGPLNTAGNEKLRAAERRWQQIQSHPIRGIEIMFILKGAVGFDWFRGLLDDTRLTFSRDEPSFKLSQLLTSSPTPNTKERSPEMEQSICSYWEIYKPENGYWFKKIAPDARAFATVAGWDATAHWSECGIKRVEKLQDLGLLQEVGVSIPARAYQIGIEEFELRFVGDTFSFSIRLSENGLDALHEFARIQYTTVLSEKLIPLGTQFSGVQLLEIFYRQLQPRDTKETPKREFGFAGMSGPGGKAISFFPVMPKGFMQTPESKEYTFTITVPAKVETSSRIKELEQKLKSNSGDAESSAVLASLYSHEGRLQDAIRCLETATEHATATAEVYGMLADNLTKIGRFEEALTHFQKASALKPENAAAQCGLGICMHELGRDDEALTYFEAAAHMESSNAAYQSNHGMWLMKAKRYSEAIAAYRRAVELAPENGKCAMWLGLLLDEEGNGQEAAGYLEKATQLSPESAEAHQIFGIHLATSSQHEKAIASFQRAIDIEENARRCELLGASLADLDRWEEAEKAFRRGVELDPNNPEMVRNLGVTLVNQSRLAEAVQCFERAVSIDPTDSAAQQSLTGLRESMAQS